MRCVLDTNILVSAFLWQGLPGQLIERAIAEQIQLLTSQPLLDELADVLPRKHLAKKVLATGQTVPQLLHNYQRLATRVTARALDRPISRDLGDDNVLACALAGKAKLIDSGDKELLVLGAFQNIPILTPVQPARCATR